MRVRFPLPAPVSFLPIAHFHDAFFGGGLPRCAGEDATEGGEAPHDASFFRNSLAGELRARGVMTTETVGVEIFQRSMIRRERALVESDQLHENRSGKMPENTDWVAHSQEHALHCTPL